MINFIIEYQWPIVCVCVIILIHCFLAYDFINSVECDENGYPIKGEE